MFLVGFLYATKQKIFFLYNFILKIKKAAFLGLPSNRIKYKRSKKGRKAYWQ